MDFAKSFEKMSKCWIVFNDNLACLQVSGKTELCPDFLQDAFLNHQSFNHFFTAIIQQYQQALAEALYGKSSEFKYQGYDGNGNVQYFYVTIKPLYENNNNEKRVLCCIEDVTAVCGLVRQKNYYANELMNYKKSLDQHAIVAITDRDGVILSVNDKFCEISQYSREELIGRTHKVINSKYHSKEFFRQMWHCIKQGETWHGDICNRNKSGELYWVDTTIVPLVGDDGVVDRYLAIRADITKRIKAEQEATKLALFDELTGLANRRNFKGRLDELLMEGSDFPMQHAMIMLDLDNFKDVNDAFGHVVGDEFLKQVANRIRAFDDEKIQAFRLGGDEFVLLISQCDESSETNINVVSDIAERIKAALNIPFIVEGKLINTTPSIGISVFDNALSSEEIMKSADIAMYHSKNNGKNRISFFESQLQEKVSRRAKLLSELHHVMIRDELELFYQPIFSTDTDIVGAEVLLRWNSPEFGLVSPLDFIPIAEESDLILEIGRWILKEACHQLMKWKHHPVCSEWILSVNISARQLQKKEFADEVLNIAKDFEYQGIVSKLQLEITESMLLDNIPRTIHTMEKLKEAGVRFSIDDFGTGFSSLNYLTKLPLDTLKIDRSFVSQMIGKKNDMIVVKAIISLAKSLNLHVVAEGVETKAQLERLKELECDYFQGFLLSRPMNIAALQQLLS